MGDFVALVVSNRSNRKKDVEVLSCVNKNQAGADVGERLCNLILLLEAYGFIMGLIKLIERIIQIYLSSVGESQRSDFTLPVTGFLPLLRHFNTKFTQIATISVTAVNKG